MPPLPSIAHLTPAQAADLDRYRQQWQATALSVSAIDPIQAAASIQAAFAQCDLPVPQQVVVVASPITAIFEAIKRQRDCTAPAPSPVSCLRLLTLTARLTAQLEFQLHPDLSAYLRQQLFDPLQQIVNDSFTQPISGTLEQSLRSPVLMA